MKRSPRPAARTLRVWDNGRDVTDLDPATWPWPYADWWAQGWRPSSGPNSGESDDAGVPPAEPHSTSGYDETAPAELGEELGRG